MQFCVLTVYLVFNIYIFHHLWCESISDIMLSQSYVKKCILIPKADIH